MALLALRRLEEQLEGTADFASQVGLDPARSRRGHLGPAGAGPGLHPRCSHDAASRPVRAGAARSSIPVELDLRLGDLLPPAVEAAAYYVCAEAVTNAVKHARASKVELGIVHDDGS